MPALDQVIDAAARLAGRPGRVVLHSGRDDDGCGRWSFVACDPSSTIEARGRQIVVRDAAGRITSEREGDPFEALVQLMPEGAGHRGARDSPVPTLIGYLGYDLGRTIEHLPDGPRVGDDLPDMWFGCYGAVWRYDHASGRADLVGDDPAAARQLAALLAREPRLTEPPRFGELRADLTDADYRARVERVREYIAAGDVYQVNLARRLVAPVVSTGDALALYAALVARSPAAYGALLELGGATIVSGSPERFLHRSRGSSVLETRPIKGTRRRTSDAQVDATLAAELARDTKEQAEHLMIVDLERNDLGKVARIGSVRVDALGYVVELPTLYHMVSRVSCELRDGIDAAQILRATFPGGSITGAPKLRAMQLIDELEPARRGPYTGAIGYLGAGGAIDLAITIRSLVITAGEARLHVGGGIVADSTAERELEETEEKASAWRAVLTPTW